MRLRDATVAEPPVAIHLWWSDRRIWRTCAWTCAIERRGHRPFDDRGTVSLPDSPGNVRGADRSSGTLLV